MGSRTEQLGPDTRSEAAESQGASARWPTRRELPASRARLIPPCKLRVDRPNSSGLRPVFPLRPTDRRIQKCATGSGEHSVSRTHQQILDRSRTGICSQQVEPARPIKCFAVKTTLGGPQPGHSFIAASKNRRRQIKHCGKADQPITFVDRQGCVVFQSPVERPAWPDDTRKIRHRDRRLAHPIANDRNRYARRHSLRTGHWRRRNNLVERECSCHMANIVSPNGAGKAVM